MNRKKPSYVTYSRDPEVWAKIRERNVLVVDNDTQQEVLMMEDCLAMMEEAVREEGQGAAANRTKSGIYLPTPDPSAWHHYVSMEGGIRKWNVVAVRIRSNISRQFTQFGLLRHDFYAGVPGVYSGLVFLFSAVDGALMAIVNDGHIQHMRVAAVSALSAKYMSRPDSEVVGIFGSGGMAVTHAWAMSCVRNVKRIKVYSPNAEHRRRFAEQMTKDLEIEVVALDEPREVVEGSHIVCACTNADQPVIRGQWLEPGMHITTVTPTAGELEASARRRLSRYTIYRSGTARQVYTTPEDWRPRSTGGTTDKSVAEEEELIGGEKMSTLSDIVLGGAVGRGTEREITAFSSEGTGVQFAAIGYLAYQKAQERGLGQRLPLELFLQHIHS